jgi:hypothetical protein
MTDAPDRLAPAAADGLAAAKGDSGGVATRLVGRIWRDQDLSP